MDTDQRGPRDGEAMQPYLRDDDEAMQVLWGDPAVFADACMTESLT